MNIKDIAGLVKYIINCIAIAITNCYLIAVGKTFYLIITNTRDIFSVTFSVNWCLANSLNTR